MPIFGLVWVASWVNCFFSSSQDLLRAPSYLANSLPTPVAAHVSGTRSALLPTAHNSLKTTLSVSSPTHTFGQPKQSVPLGLSASALPFSLDASLPTLGFFGAVKGLISGFQKLTAIHAPIPVVVTQADPTQVAQVNISHSGTAGLGFGQCLPIAKRHDASGSFVEPAITKASLLSGQSEGACCECSTQAAASKADCSSP